jgi:hypothetical protein
MAYSKAKLKSNGDRASLIGNVSDRCLPGEIRVASRGQKIVRVASRVVNPTVKGMYELRPRLLRVRVRVASRGQFSGIKVVGKTEHL